MRIRRRILRPVKPWEGYGRVGDGSDGRADMQGNNFLIVLPVHVKCGVIFIFGYLVSWNFLLYSVGLRAWLYPPVCLKKLELIPEQ